MLYPIVKETKTYNLMTTEFGGYNHSLKPREGEFFDTENITTDYYPIASGRKKRGIVRRLNSPSGMTAKDSLIYVNDYPGEHDRMDPYISPLFGSFKGFPPMLIQAGSIEMLLSDSVDAAAKARSQGVKVRLSVYEGMFHVFQMGYLNIPESKRAWCEIKKFLQIVKEEE